MILDKLKAKLSDTTGMFTGISFGVALSDYLDKKLKTKEISDALDKAACSPDVKDMVLHSFEKLFDNSRKVLVADIDRRNQWFATITATYESRIGQLSETTLRTPELEESFADIEQSMTAGAVTVSLVGYKLLKQKAHISLQQYILRERPDLIPGNVSVLDPDVVRRANKQLWTQWEVVCSLYDNEPLDYLDAVWFNILAQSAKRASHAEMGQLPQNMLP